MKLSPLELEVLGYIHQATTTTAPAVHRQISAQRDTAYSTIKTVFDRLEKKGAIYRQSNVGRTSIYAAKIEQQDIQASVLSDLLNRVFANDRTTLFNTLIRDSELSDDEVAYLKQLIKDKSHD